MQNTLKYLTAMVATVILSGCASVSHMPLSKEATALDTTQKSVLVARLKIKNANATSHQPNLLAVFTTQQIAGKEESFSFTSPTLVKDDGEGGKDYLISMTAEPGKTKISLARFMRQIPLLLMAMADLPFQEEIDVPANKILYLGNIEATIVKRDNDSQPRAGAVLPLIDQAIAGFSSGTFEVKVSDQFDADSQEMLKQFPILAGKSIEKLILPAWTHPELRQAPSAQPAQVAAQ